MASARANRFEMLINVAVSGNKEMAKLAQTAKGAAVESGKFGDVLKKIDVTASELGTKMGPLKDALKAYTAAEKTHNAALKSKLEMDEKIAALDKRRIILIGRKSAAAKKELGVVRATLKEEKATRSGLNDIVRQEGSILTKNKKILNLKNFFQKMLQVQLTPLITYLKG